MADSKYLVLARKWRPQQFDDVVGQEHITRTLKNAIASGRIHHAFLFIGSRGIGKTTTARVLAKALNCLESDEPTPTPCGKCSNCTSIQQGTNIDVIEIDGASNNSVDDVREIRDNVRMVPTNSRYKVYIVDEVHQLSIAAFNALLKTLEEPPPHAVFVLATTEAHKVPATIVSRCQRYDFRRVATDRIIALLKSIIERENVQASDEALFAIARAAEGGIRDAESILDELITYCEQEITFDDVFAVLGLVDWQVLHSLCEAMLDKDIARQLTLVEDVVASGKDLSQFVQEILRYFRNLLVCKTAGGEGLLHLPEEELAELRAHADRFMLTQLIRLVEQFAELTSGFDSQLAQRIALEALLIRVSKVSIDYSVDSILEKLVQLGAGGISPQGAPAGAPPGKPANPPEAAAPSTASAPAARPQRGTPKTDPGPRKPAEPVAEIEDEPAAKAAPEPEPPKEASVSAPAAECDEEPPEPPPDYFDEEYGDDLPPDEVPVRRGHAAMPMAAMQTDLPFYPTANPADARAAAADPKVAHVLEVFKGKIAEVRKDAAPQAAQD